LAFNIHIKTSELQAASPWYTAHRCWPCPSPGLSVAWGLSLGKNAGKSMGVSMEIYVYIYIIIAIIYSHEIYIYNIALYIYDKWRYP
jgi:hypothetical protein